MAYIRSARIHVVFLVSWNLHWPRRPVSTTFSLPSGLIRRRRDNDVLAAKGFGIPLKTLSLLYFRLNIIQNVPERLFITLMQKVEIRSSRIATSHEMIRKHMEICQNIIIYYNLRVYVIMMPDLHRLVYMYNHRESMLPRWIARPRCMEINQLI